jgi:ribosomal protein L37AE/L43A
MTVAPLARTLDQELVALIRGASLECLVCGEFVMHLPNLLKTGVIACPECRTLFAEGDEIPEVELPSVMQAG